MVQDYVHLSMITSIISQLFWVYICVCVHSISVENAYLDEKEDACCALGELALNTGWVVRVFLLCFLFSFFFSFLWYDIDIHIYKLFYVIHHSAWYRLLTLILGSFRSNTLLLVKLCMRKTLAILLLLKKTKQFFQHP